MKNFFKTNDDWHENNKIIKFDTKIKPKKNSKKVNKEKINDNENDEKNIPTNPSIHGTKPNCIAQLSETDNKINQKKCKKKRRKQKKIIIEEFDVDCKYTPLLRKELIPQLQLSNQNNKDTSEKHEPIKEDVNPKNSKKRKNTDEDNNNIKKKQAVENIDKKVETEIKTKITAEEANIDLANKLREKLMGGRFRYLNEQLYTVPGNKAKDIFEKDKEAFKAYHQGYRQQVEKWPFNPLDRIIKRVRRLPKHMVIADFGCGEGQLAQSIKHECLSIDLVSTRSDVIACDMANTPLKPKSVDVVVFCLSLMGINLSDFICEANRVLKKDGTVFVAEIASRFEKLYEFKKLWEHLGFELLRQDVDKKNYFYFFDFKKVENINKSVLTVSNCSLKPCIYKKR